MLKSPLQTPAVNPNPKMFFHCIQDSWNLRWFLPVTKIFGKGQWVMVAFDLTLPGERVYRGEVGDVMKEIGGKKGEFVLVVGR